MAGSQTDDLKEKVTKLHREGEERAAKRLAEKLGLTYADLSKMPISLEAVRVIPEGKAKDAKAASVELKQRKVAVAAVNPELPATKALIKELQGEKYEAKIIVVSQSSLDTAWRFYKFIKPITAEITGKIKITKERLEDLRKRLTSFDAVRAEFGGLNYTNVSPVTLIEVILGGAIAMRASDIHTEEGQKNAKIRFRVDGLLHDVFDEMPLRAYEALVSRIKLLSEMKLNVRDEAQDGRFTIGLADKEIEMRVSVIPAEFGETIVMRILDPSATMVGLPDLGLREDNLVLVKKQLNKPNGLILNDDWYDFENQREEEALREWARENEIELES